MIRTHHFEVQITLAKLYLEKCLLLEKCISFAWLLMCIKTQRENVSNSYISVKISNVKINIDNICNLITFAI